MDPIGKSPVPVPILIIGKLAMAGSWLFFLFKRWTTDTIIYDSAVAQTAGILIAASGLLVVILAFVFLGRSVSVGLPEEKTELRTQGLYRVSRNPMDLGGFLICAGSCLFAIHLVNLLLFAIAVWVHHRIVTSEERFLEERFGQQWLDYKQQVPRYVGKI